MDARVTNSNYIGCIYVGLTFIFWWVWEPWGYDAFFFIARRYDGIISGRSLPTITAIVFVRWSC